MPKAVSSELAPQIRVLALMETELPNQSKIAASGAMSFADWIGSQSCALVVGDIAANRAPVIAMAGLFMRCRGVFFRLI